jgi:murein DD-endopeptidase MepM/ murein hydrolase activator NlpD
MKKLLYFLVIILLTGCARTVYRPTRPTPTFPRGVYHRIEKGETLWRIAKTYGVEVEKIKSYNNIRDVEDIKVGTLIFIPRAEKKLHTTYPISVGKIGREGFMWPAQGRIVSYFDFGKGGTSKGIDVALPFGSEVRASKGGIVTYADVLRGYGKVVIIDHKDGFSTVYAHNSKILVKENSSVGRGEVIALAGDSGHCESPLLHFEIRKGETPQDPLSYLP